MSDIGRGVADAVGNTLFIVAVVALIIGVVAGAALVAGLTAFGWKSVLFCLGLLGLVMLGFGLGDAYARWGGP